MININKVSQVELSHPKYRADIDGLRAFAVLSVVFFHAFPGRVAGGFIGVDVFFVISGYLISTIIFQNIEKNTFTFSEFYIRRIKRIFPALLIVLFSCLIFGWFLLLGDEYEQLGKHISAGAGFFSNIVLWKESGYFDVSAEFKPLLHLWSLGVEEQFYILWPVLIWGVSKKKVSMLFILTLVFSLSFLINIFGINKYPSATFYLPFSRFWELSVGGLISYVIANQSINTTFSSLTSNILSTIGGVCLISAVFLINKSNAFPGWWALIPVIGVALIIISGSNAWVNRVILSQKIVVWFGLISFPLYLWHWPILSFGSIAEGGRQTVMFRLSAIIASILLAWMTYRFVESRIRYSKGSKYLTYLVLANLVIFSAGIYVYFNDGLLNRNAVLKSGLNENVRNQLVGNSWKYRNNEICMTKYSHLFSGNINSLFCMQSSNNSPTVILLGNSFANQLYPGFVQNNLLKNQTFLSVGNCDFVYEVDENPICIGQSKFIYDLILSNKTIKFAVIDGLIRKPDNRYIEKLRDRIDFLESNGIKVIIFTPHLYPDFHPKACFTAPLRQVARDCTFAESDKIAINENYKNLINSISKTNPQVLFFDQNQMYCKGSNCSYILDNMPLHRDSRHLSEYGSIILQAYFTIWAKKNVNELFQ